ncbi:putative transcription regulator GNAT family [Lupinus albus]|uniref:Putative transcription regulator GNAT family n=1 Tax=Lupinus albus TaxID=3870 RepID=A0A6A4PZJ5_LUPAL|nr:putative transcription regulator GNAT family [Lupinus albus]
MATATTITLSLSFPLDLQNPRFVSKHQRFFNNPFLNLNTHSIPTFKISSSSHSHPSTTTTTTPSNSDPFRTGQFLTNSDLENLKLLDNFVYSEEIKSGSMWVRVMKEDEMDITVALLAESFAESMQLPTGYVGVLRFLVKQYLIERRTLMPHTATLIGFYRKSVDSEKEGEEENEEVELAGTVEVCFDKRGANASLPSPIPPKDNPYICNMAVQKSLRRRGIGWHLLKASEELISQMSSSREVYLHCRMIDTAPFNMYTKADYKIVKTDSILVLLLLQRRKHLMCKKLHLLSMPSEIDLSDSDL